MILWNCNDKLSQNEVEKISTILKHEKYFFKKKFYTNYFYTENNEFDFLNNFYLNKINKFMGDLGLKERSKCAGNYWVQLYNSKTDGHTTHDHFSGAEIISWVHFVSSPSKECFYFQDFEGNKKYPKQKTGDFICFSPWLLHGSDAPQTDECERIIVAGNIDIFEYESNSLILESSKTDNTFTWKKTDKSID
jgi:hypothetical protein